MTYPDGFYRLTSDMNLEFAKLDEAYNRLKEQENASSRAECGENFCGPMTDLCVGLDGAYVVVIYFGMKYQRVPKAALIDAQDPYKYTLVWK